VNAVHNKLSGSSRDWLPATHMIEKVSSISHMPMISNSSLATEESPLSEFSTLVDRHRRTITDLRISVTDRCNYRCVYCRTGNEGPQYTELPIADYLRMARVFVDLGIQKVRLTGGEPLLRNGLVELVSELAKLRTRPQNESLDIAITTNGHLLEAQAMELKRAGLTRLTVSMDAVESDTFARITRVPGSFEKVKRGIEAAQEAGFGSIKVNCVLLRGFNEDQIVPFAKFSGEHGVIVRFIEFMPLEEDRTWKPESVIPISELVARLEQFRPLVRLPQNAPGETAVRYTFDDGLGEIGIIAPVSQAFCGQCGRIRLTSDGRIRTCLFSQFDHNLYSVMQRSEKDEDMVAFIRKVITQKEAHPHIGEPDFLKPSRSMVHIGG
jgi:GTP 3',8-cyclase